MLQIRHNANSSAPFRLDRNEASACDNDNHYTDEQKAYYGGPAGKFPETTSTTASGCPPALVMG
jgi:phospholipase C